MNLYLFIGIIVAMLWFAGIFLGVVKGVTKGFENTPNIEATSSREVREKFTQQASDVQEKNRRLMDDVKSKMERSRY
jgi:uncharacterized protein YoxC